MFPIKNRYTLPPEPMHRGRLADVYQGFDFVDRRDVAVKLFRIGLRDEPVVRESFRRESQRLADLRHPSLIRMLDFGDDGPDGRPYLVLEWGGNSLDQWLKQGVSFRDWFDFYESVGRKLLSGVAYAHSRETAHRELKPSDFLISPSDGEFRLADFGVSKYPEFLDQALQIEEFIRANEPFSPQNGYDPNHSESTDVWGFAVVCLYVLTRASGVLERWTQINDALATLQAPEEVRAVLRDALSPDAVERPPNASVLLQRLDAARSKVQRSTFRSACGLTLGPKAKEQFRGLFPGMESQAKIEAELLNDLNDGPPLIGPFFGKDPAGHRPVLIPDTFVLLGGSLSLIAKVDGLSQSRLFITGISRSPDTVHERHRQDAWDPDLQFILGTAPSGASTIHRLLQGHQNFLEKASERKRQREEESLFENWTRLLQLRMDHAGKGESYNYEGFEADENHYIFKTTERVDPTILNETWMVEGTKLIGEVADTDGYAVTLYVERRVPGGIPKNGRLVIDARATQGQLKRQLHALKAVRFPSTPRQEVLKKCLVHPADAERSLGAVDNLVWISPDIDENKQSVIKAVLCSADIFKVEGPPGTGKTTFIAELILQFLKRHPGKRILLTSQTHIAVDNAIEKIVPFRPDLRITRVGFQEAKVAESVHPHLLTNRLEPWRKKTRQESERFVTQFAKRKGFDAEKIQQGIDIGLLLQARRELAQVERRENEVEAALLKVRESLEATSPSGEDLVDAEQSEALESERDRLRDELNDMRESRQRRAQAKRAAEKDFLRNYPAEKDLVKESDAELEMWRDGLVGDNADARQVRALFELQAEWLQRFTRDDDCKEIILLDSDLIAGTCIGIASGDTEDEGYGLCIVDEASKATLPEALVPMIRSERWVLVGDQKQLPPFMDAALQNERLSSGNHVAKDVVLETLLGRLDRLELPQHAQAKLNQQYRMVPAIGDLVSTIFYNGELFSVGTRQPPPTLTAVASRPVVWFSTSRQPNRREQSPNGSAFNPLEAEWAATLLGRLDFYQNKSNANGDGQKLKVVLLTGYAAQRGFLQEQIAKVPCPSLEIECHTVDAYQGREADVVVFSITRSNVEGRPGFLKSAERVNVALSRARFALWIVGDADFCRDLGSATSLAAVRDYIESHPDDCAIKEGIK